MFWASTMLFFAWLLALIQSVLPFCYPLPTKRLVYYLSRFQFALLMFLFFRLMWAFASNDFSFSYVATNSNSHLPLVYRLGAVWGGHEGSILLWIFILSLWSFVLVSSRKQMDHLVFLRVNAVLSAISAGFLLFALTLSNPFLQQNFSAQQEYDLNPLLQDPGLVFHPPLLYMGYVGFAVTFAWAMAALWQGNFDRHWARWMQPWALAAWCFLTLGILSGSWWAYRVLGWGGWWFWDPVENVSLLPWLAGTALIHSLHLLKQALFKSWVLLLAILTFALSLLGTFVVRSGILVSVHAFAVDPSRGFFMLGLFGVFVGTALLLYALRNKKITQTALFIPLFTRQTGLLANNILLGIMLFTVLLGTLYPIFIEALGMGKLSIGAPYFNTVLAPFAVLLLFLIAWPIFLTQAKCPSSKVKLLLFWLSVSILLSTVLILTFAHPFKWSVLLGLTLAIWIVLSLFNALWNYRQKKQTWKQIFLQHGAMLLAHLGVALSTIGIIISSFYSEQHDVQMQVGDGVWLANQYFILHKIEERSGPNYDGIIATLIAQSDPATSLSPELRYYPFVGITISKPSIDVSVFSDRYAALAEPLIKETWSFRFYYKPFIRWIWLGGFFMIAGGLCALGRLKKYRYRSKA